MKLKNKKYIVLIVAFIYFNTNAQEISVKIEGVVKNDSIELQDINIINKTKNLGTSSNAKGEFTMYISVGDSIQFSSINYKTRTIVISLNHLKTKQIIVFLEQGLNELNEIAIKQKVRLDFGKVSLPRGAIYEKDKIDLIQPPNARNLTDPTSPAGSNTGDILGLITFISEKIFEKTRERKKEEKRMKRNQQNFPDTILEKYGEDFFTKGLTIDKNDVYLFIDFCKDNGLKEYYLSDEFTTKNFIVIQSKKFLEIKKQ